MWYESCVLRFAAGKKMIATLRSTSSVVAVITAVAFSVPSIADEPGVD